MTVSIEGGNSAKILTSDILLSNGVVHILDSVLMSSLLANLAPDSATGGATTCSGSGCIGNGLELLSAQRSESFRKWGEGSIASMELSDESVAIPMVISAVANMVQSIAKVLQSVAAILHNSCGTLAILCQYFLQFVSFRNRSPLLWWICVIVAPDAECDISELRPPSGFCISTLVITACRRLTSGPDMCGSKSNTTLSSVMPFRCLSAFGSHPQLCTSTIRAPHMPHITYEAHRPWGASMLEGAESAALEMFPIYSVRRAVASDGRERKETIAGVPEMLGARRIYACSVKGGFPPRASRGSVLGHARANKSCRALCQKKKRTIAILATIRRLLHGNLLQRKDRSTWEVAITDFAKLGDVRYLILMSCAGDGACSASTLPQASLVYLITYLEIDSDASERSMMNIAISAVFKFQAPQCVFELALLVADGGEAGVAQLGLRMWVNRLISQNQNLPHLRPASRDRCTLCPFPELGLTSKDTWIPLLANNPRGQSRCLPSRGRGGANLISTLVYPLLSGIMWVNSIQNNPIFVALIENLGPFAVLDGCSAVPLVPFSISIIAC
ncbi:hypothetical protein HYDPIDRAFT_171528 [Hydnomerulius pinastri MD-312]|uniref:FAS1 domain-containing protein n=1 Tax=Hydnomerulius pinastri MD-312 TaxID=994086 RepID=A0A0C9UXQ3_9AGAM|nr:hypothetical protein HYDPIDRAFT_171528 [Hydnomerulius pinastri MD-312]